MNTTDFSAILLHSGAEMGFEGLCLDEENACTLMIRETLITMIWFRATDSLLMYAPLGELPPELEDWRLYRAMLEMDMQSRGKLCVPGLDTATRLVTLGAALPGHALTPASLCAYLDMFGQEAATQKALFDELLEAYTPWSEVAEPVVGAVVRA